LKKILFITSQYRVGERIYPIIPHLAKGYELDLLKVYQMSKSYKWVGDDDLRLVFDLEYGAYFNEVFYDYCDSSKYDLIISDDNRLTSKTGLDKIYKNKKAQMLACSHGNGGFKNLEKSHTVVFDKCFTFGKYDTIHHAGIPVGIPANDKLFKYQKLNKKHILIIVNFLGNRDCPYKFKFDYKFFNDEKLKILQDYYKLPIIIKLKSRADENGVEHNIKYLKEVLPDNLNYRILVDVKDDNQLISESKIVISAPSTLAFKPIQLGIPTVLIKNSGEVGSFENYDGFFDIDDDFLEYIYLYKKKKDFIENTITGGLEFNSTTLMVNEIKKFL